MPGTCTSMPYLAVPLVFDGTSMRPMSLRPISLNCAGFFRSASAIFGGSRRNLGELRHVAIARCGASTSHGRRSSGSVVSSPTGTFHSAATASSSTLRACAPADAQRHEVAGHRDARRGDLRALEQLVRVAVNLRDWPARTRIFTFDQSASSSSARISGSDVSTPCPISAVGQRMVMVLSAPMRHPGVELGRPSAASAFAGAAEQRAAEREREGQTGRALDEAAAGDVGRALMCLFMPQASFAARWIARAILR